MGKKRFAGGRPYRTAAIGGWILLLAACVAQQQPEPVQAAVAADAQPRLATYDCGDVGSMTIENDQSFIRVTDASGTTVELPEVPESGGMRYAEGATAVVLEGQEALVMAGRHEPVSCHR
ncbi:MAG TPA: hypothetical protein VMF90_19835 [Rhizobiaceae bacterium]|nr:hypothetical protein [Rhizobiaceae bacterium]